MKVKDTQTKQHGEKDALYRNRKRGFIGQMCNHRQQEEVLKDATEKCGICYVTVCRGIIIIIIMIMTW